MPGEMTEAINIPSRPYEDAHHENSYGSIGCNVSSYVQLNTVETTSSLEATDDTVHEENDLPESSNHRPVTPPPVDLLPGESIEETADFSDCRLVLTNFRLCIISLPGDSDQFVRVIPQMSIDSLNFTHPVLITVVCKEGKIFNLTATSNEQAICWHRKLMKLTMRPSVSEAFAWKFAEEVENNRPTWLKPASNQERDTCQEEWDLLGYDPDYFKICDDNADYSLIETYPKRIVVPKWMNKPELQDVITFRVQARIPAIVYVHQETKALLLRSSQPSWKVILGRTTNDVDQNIVLHAIDFTKRYRKADEAAPERNSAILDARSNQASYLNIMRGGGFERAEYYGNAEYVNLEMDNIHKVRDSFSQLRTAISADYASQENYLYAIGSTKWLDHLGKLMRGVSECVDRLERGTNVLVHCSDGWDRTTQIVALAKLTIDHRYRTLQGFELLIQREWIEFGHKFADRNGVYGSDMNERCPIFLQWLDAVWQLWIQNETAFEFNKQYLIKLAQHATSGLFGNFLFNSVKDAAQDIAIRKKSPISIWQYLGRHNDQVVNQIYDPTLTKGRLQSFHSDVKSMTIWKEFYLTDLAASIASETAAAVSSPTSARPATTNHLKETPQPLQKCKSSDSLNASSEMHSSMMTSHFGSGGPLNQPALMEGNIMTESFLRRDAKTSSMRSRKQNVKNLVDSDGMIKFYDCGQEYVRRLKKEYSQQIERNRKRQDSERTTHSAGSRAPRDRMISCDELDLDNMSIDRAPSDVSLFENSDMPVQHYWQVEATNCALCRLEFSKLSYRQEDREHHCRKCGSAVCEKCSNNRFHEVQEGKGVQLRACDDCYQKMTSEDGTIHEEEEEGVLASPPIPCSGRERDESFTSLSSGSLTLPVMS